MLQFEEYRWEDHVPRKGSWKFNLTLNVAAFAVIAAALHYAPSDTGEDLFTATVVTTTDLMVGAVERGNDGVATPTSS